MIVLSRHSGEAVVVGSRDSHWVIAVLSLQPAGVSLRIAHSSGFDIQDVELTTGQPIHAGTTIEIRLVDVRADSDRVRIGFIAPKATPVHRQEVWKAIYSKSADV